MSTPENLLEKKPSGLDVELTSEERIGRLEIALENAYNVLAKQMHEQELRGKDERKSLEGELSRALTLMNMSTLQNIVAIREIGTLLVENKTIDGAILDERMTVEIGKAVEAQKAAMQKANDEAVAKAMNGKSA